MSQPSFQASNAIIYLTYGAFLVTGTYIALTRSNAKNFVATLRTQKAIPLALNFIASTLGSGILFSYPQLGTIAGIQGAIIYAVSSALPILTFAWFAPYISRQCPDGFVLTEWAHERFGVITGLWLTFLTLVTMFLYMIAELSAIGQVITALTGLDSLPAVIVECVVTTIYTTLGGYVTSFFTDNIQGGMIVLLLIICSIAIGAETTIDPSTIQDSGLLGPSLLGWQLIYLFPVAITFNDYFLAQFWLRTFSAKSQKDLWWGCGIAAVVIFIFLLLLGMVGVVAVWAGVVQDLESDGPVAFFLLIAELPAWVVGFVLVFAVSLSTAVFDSFQSAMVSTASQNLFRNRLPTIYVRGLVILVVVPTVVLSLKAPDILQIFLISDLVSASAMPVMLLGMLDCFHFLREFEVIVSGLGGYFTIFLFGLVYYEGDAYAAAQLLILEEGLYGEDWSAFGAFAAAPLGAILWGAAALLLRLGFVWFQDKRRGAPFSGFERKRSLQELPS